MQNKPILSFINNSSNNKYIERQLHCVFKESFQIIIKTIDRTTLLLLLFTEDLDFLNGLTLWLHKSKEIMQLIDVK
jgi:hypothetical protein